MRKVVGATDKGLVRASNQDQFVTRVLSPRLSYGVVCDGMGGENGGNVASELAIQFAQTALERELNDSLSEMSIHSIFTSLFSSANALIYDEACQEESLQGMGTTMVAAILLDSTLYMAWVGDSRGYLVSPDGLRQITKDHTMVQMMLDNGELSQEDAQVHPKRHYITRAVGVAPTVEMDFVVEQVEPSQYVLICSDGLYNFIQWDNIYTELSQTLQENNLQSIIQQANEAGGGDNITLIVME